MGGFSRAGARSATRAGARRRPGRGQGRRPGRGQARRPGRGQAPPLPCYVRIDLRSAYAYRVGAGLVPALENPPWLCVHSDELRYGESGYCCEFAVAAIRLQTPVEFKRACAGPVVSDLEVAVIVFPDRYCQRALGHVGVVRVDFGLHIPRLGQVEMEGDVDNAPD